MVLFWNLLYISVCPVDQLWKWAFQISKCREHNWSTAPATVPGNASITLFVWGPCFPAAPSHHLRASGMLNQAHYGKHWLFWWEILPEDILAQLDATTHPALFSSSLSFYSISDLPRRPMAFSVFPTSLAVFLRSLSINKSPTYLILLLSTSWGPGITHWYQFPFCFPFCSSFPYAFIIEMPPQCVIA